MARERRISGGAPPGAVPPAMPPMAQMAAMAQMGRGMPPMGYGGVPQIGMPPQAFMPRGPGVPYPPQGGMPVRSCGRAHPQGVTPWGGGPHPGP